MNAASDSPAAATVVDMTEYPWTLEAWQRVAAADDLHHGLLITGPDGVAKREFAFALANLLLCEQPGAAACRRCRNCTLFAAGSHPDVHILTTELEARDGRIALAAQYCLRYQDLAARERRANPSRVISVDQVRRLGERFTTHAHIARRKIAIIVPADRMNINAANALLKLLEEPPADSILLLVSAAPGYLPATVRSRCLKIGIAPPPAEATREWLAARMPTPPPDDDSGPLETLRRHQDGTLSLRRDFAQGAASLAAGKTTPLEFAAQLAKHDFAAALEWLHGLSCTLLRAACGGGDGGGDGGAVRLAANQRALERGFALYDKVGRYRKLARDPLNQQLALEELALSLQGVLHR